jgi:hypothetical protein
MEPTLAGNRLIRRLLACLLDQAPRAAMVSLSILGADELGADNRTLDLGCSYHRVIRATPGKRFDSLARRVPGVPNWQVLQPSLRAGQGIVLRVADLLPGPLPDRLSPTRAAYVLACPAISATGHPAGAVLIVFDIADPAPRGAELRRLRREGARIASQIVAVLELVAQARALSPCAEAA